MSASADIIDRIKKLLRLARSSNPHEAQQALARAMALAAEHRVEIEGLNPDESEKAKATTHRDTEPESRLSYDKRYALAICRAFFRISTVEVECIRVVNGWPARGVKIMWVGTRSDIEIGEYVYAFLVRHFAWCWRTYRGRFRNRQAYVHGMYIGLRVKLAEQMPPKETREAKGNELVVADQKAYIAAVIGKTTSKPMGAPDHAAKAAEYAGYLEGRKTEIRAAVHAPKEQTLALR